MRRFLITALLSTIVTVLSFAKDESVNRTYFMKLNKEYRVNVSYNSSGELFTIIYCDGGKRYEDTCITICEESNLRRFRNELIKMKEKYLEWDAVAKANGVKEFTKYFDFNCPECRVSWYGSKWYFTDSGSSWIKPQFMVLTISSGETRSIISIYGVCGDHENEYITQTYDISFYSVEELESLIKVLDVDSILEELNGEVAKKQNVESLFN